MICALLWGAVTGLILASSLLARANATVITPAPIDICGALRDHISLANIETALEATGLTPTAAGGYTGTVVRTQCPELIGYVIGTIA